MLHQGDPHNFGQRVTATNRASGTYFQKPRPVYWEWLFFGATSPLKKCFDTQGERGTKVSENLFNLDVQIKTLTSGESRSVEAANLPYATARHAYSLGVLLAYTYIFGIRDLHRHNLVMTPTHLQVIDAEIVFARLLLPYETLLLPFKEISASEAGVGHLLVDAESKMISSEAARSMLEGYCDTFSCTIQARSLLLAEFETRRDELCKIPIRHILRDTVNYRRTSSKSQATPFCEAELAQMARGDIPYFFKFIGDPELLEYSDAVGTPQQVRVPDAFIRAVNREAVEPTELLSLARLESNFPTGLLFLAKHQLVSEGTTKLRLNGALLEITPDTVSATLDRGVFQATRTS